MSRVTRDQARAAKTRARELFAGAGALAGVGITRVAGGYAVKVNLSEPLPEGMDVPATVDGVPLRVEVVGRIRRRC